MAGNEAYKAFCQRRDARLKSKRDKLLAAVSAYWERRDGRLSARGLAPPARTRLDEDSWITTKTGSHVLLGEGGEIKGGMGGKFTGRKISDVSGESQAGSKSSISSGGEAEKDRTLTGRKPETQAIYDKARENDKKIAPDMDEIAKANGGELAGLEFSVKTASSVEDKIRRKMQKDPTQTEEDIIAKMGDIVRYTQRVEHGKISGSALKTIDKLQEKGYNILEVDNKYLDPESNYKGLHINAESPNGQKFELQIHSRESLEVKDKIHPLYEESRKAGTSKARQNELDAEMKKISDSLPVPENIGDVRSMKI